MMKHEPARAGRWTRRLQAALCAGSLALLAACGGSGGVTTRFEAISYQGEAAIRDNVTGIVWAAALNTATGRVAASQELLTLADLDADTLARHFGFAANRLVRAAEPVGSVTTSAWVVDFGQQRAGGLSDEAIDPAAPFPRWRVLLPQGAAVTSYQDQVNGVVTQGNLMWSACTLGATFDTTTRRCSGTPQARDFAGAQAAAAASSLGGYRDWRLPTKQELQLMLRVDSTQDSLMAPVFSALDAFDPAVPLQYWTSSTSTPANSSWIVDFSLVSDFGGVELIDRTQSQAWVRLVRTSF